MSAKERKGGQLTNKEVEEELQRKGGEQEGQGYKGSQDTGDAAVREKGTATQQEDGTGETQNSSEE